MAQREVLGRTMKLLCVCCVFACAISCATIRAAVGPDGQTDSASPITKAAPDAWAFEGGSPDTVPQVRLVSGTQLNCTGPSGGAGFAGEAYNEETKRIEPTCLGGLTIDTAQVLVADYGETAAQSALCHEDWHARLFYLRVVYIGHDEPGFKPGGIVEKCQAYLEGR